MMDLAAVSHNLHITLVLILSICGFLLWRDYRIDALRERLFALRGELFAYAESQGRDFFREPAYRQLRETMNGMIRFSHKLTFSRLVLSILIFKFFPVPTDDIVTAWLKVVSKLKSEEIREQLLNFHWRIFILVARHLVNGSLILWLVVIVVGASLVIRGVYRRIFDVISERLVLRHPKGLCLLENQASRY